MKGGRQVIVIFFFYLQPILSASGLAPVHSRLPSPPLVVSTRSRNIPSASVHSSNVCCVLSPTPWLLPRRIVTPSSSSRIRSFLDSSWGISKQREFAADTNPSNDECRTNALAFQVLLVRGTVARFRSPAPQRGHLKNSLLPCEQPPRVHSSQKGLSEEVSEESGRRSFVQKDSSAASVEASEKASLSVEESSKRKSVPKVLQISDAAQKKLMEMRKDGAQLLLRLGVKSGGCSGLSYNLSAISESEVGDSDHMEQFDFGAIAIDPQSFFYVFGTILDYSEQLMGGGFRVKNPNASKTCGCGQSFGVPKSFIHKHIESKPTKCSEK